MAGTHNQTQLSSFVGKSTPSIKKYFADGIIEKEANGKYDPGICARNIIAHLTEIAAGRASGESGISITDERARLAKEQADKIAMDNEVARGELLPRGEVETGIIGVMSTIRTRLLAIPAKLAPEVAIKKKAAECAIILTGGIHDVLDEISNIEVTTRFKLSTVCKNCGQPNDLFVGDASAVKPNRKRVGGSKKKTKSGSKRGAGKVANKSG